MSIWIGTANAVQRRPESELWREFEIARPRILGTLLDAAAHGLRALDGVHLEGLPRMADFALGDGLRNSTLARWHLCSRLRDKPQSGHREHHRSRPDRHVRACPHGRPDHVDRERVRPFAFVCGECSR
jgi:hypothetical protein